MFIPTFVTIVLFLSCERDINGFNVDGNNWDPFLFVSKDLDESPNYDITRWVRQLHLQQCAFVEIGEGFCALFVELRSIPSESKVLDNSDVGEFFLGICPCLTLHSWDLCSPELTRLRKVYCTYTESTPYSNTSARVHRRLCDITMLSTAAPNCNCSLLIAGQRLYETKGFPTCFLNPLPVSLCSPRGVCGIAHCSTSTIKGIHTVKCASNCHQRQPFCEEIGPWTSVPPEINSLWSRWSAPKCNNTCGTGFMVSFAYCQDQVTGKPAVDCIGPGSFCCPDTFGKCYCEVDTVDGITRAIRFTEPCIYTEGCIPSSVGTFTFEGEFDSNDEEEINNDDRERFDGSFPNSEIVRSTQRRLQQSYSRGDEYGLLENRLPNKNVESRGLYRSVLRNRLDDDNEYDQDDDDDEEEGNNEESFEHEDKTEDDEDEEDEETIRTKAIGKGRWSPRKRVQEARSEYSAVAFEGRPEDDEPEKKGAMEIRSVTEDCDDDSTEPLQYYDYESAASQDGYNIRIIFALKLASLNVLISFFQF